MFEVGLFLVDIDNISYYRAFVNRPCASLMIGSSVTLLTNGDEATKAESRNAEESEESDDHVGFLSI